MSVAASPALFDALSADPREDCSTSLYRPVQYLGNKLRALEQICTEVSAVIGKTGRVGDLFAGTTVVSQALARQGHRVTSVDTQSYTSVFANALLGIGKSRADREGFYDAIDRDNSFQIHPRWEWFALCEQKALERGDFEEAQALYRELPLRWRSKPDRGSNDGEIDRPIITSIYAGSYFGVRQALQLDRLRHAIEQQRRQGNLTLWEYNAALTGVLSAASLAVHSAGKHFAQPLNAGTLGNRSFAAKRLIQDRSIAIEREFKKACVRVAAAARDIKPGHAAITMPAEEFVKRTTQSFDLFYLDPPYTAQQYSRFYHLLETLTSYDAPEVLTDGEATTGLYPANRYKSDFCSKRKSPEAFHSLIDGARRSNAALLISYSVSSKGSVGNARMISLEMLLNICFDAYGKSNVACKALNHRYRQFNSKANAVPHRNDPEILITCRTS